MNGACDFFMTLLPYSRCECRVSCWQVPCCGFITLEAFWLWHKHITQFYCCEHCSSPSRQAALLTLVLLCKAPLAKTKCKTEFQSVSFNRAMLDVPLSRTGQASVYKVSLTSGGTKSVECVLPQAQEIHTDSVIGVISTEMTETHQAASASLKRKPLHLMLLD